MHTTKLLNMELKLMLNFLPVSIDDMKKRGWEELDFIFVSGDAYVDHPSFGSAILTRMLESLGFKVGIIAQPEWKSKNDFMKLGKPRLGFLVSSGNIDSMVNHYTASKKKRNDDFYSPGGKGGFRPDRAVIVYCNKIREAYGNVPIIIGGIEASLRRFAHYDYWDDKVRNSILVDSSANILVYGMGESPLTQVANLLNDGVRINEIRNVHGTCYMADNKDDLTDFIEISSLEAVLKSKQEYARAFKIQYEEQDPIRGKTIVQSHGVKYLVQNPPAMFLKTSELDNIYKYPYMREAHPMYQEAGGIPALNEVEFSITAHRGCFGGCNFCALTSHQGRIIQARSDESIINEATLLTKKSNFKGYIHDVGGPTANFRRPSCKKQLKQGVCKHRQCLFPEPCPNLEVDHKGYSSLLRRIQKLDKVKKVFIRSGIRYDYLLCDKNNDFFYDLVKNHVSGQLKVAPEHISKKVLKCMGKPGKEVYDKFKDKYFEINKKFGLEQYLVPYLMSSHPGSDLHSAIELAEYIRDMKYNPEQVQDFYPTPGSLSTAMYHTELNPLTGEKVYVAKTYEEKSMQRALLQFKNPKNYSLVLKALQLANREDLIGFGPKCLVKPHRDTRQPFKATTSASARSSSASASTSANKGKSKSSRTQKQDSQNSLNDNKKTNSINKKTNKSNNKFSTSPSHSPASKSSTFSSSSRSGKKSSKSR
jgi:uncharacterized radical SAM protein YgiQ